MLITKSMDIKYFNIKEKHCKSKESNTTNINFKYIILCIICLKYMIYAQVNHIL